MSSPATQDFRNHSRYVIGYHFVAPLLLLANAVYAIYTLVTGFSASSVVSTMAAAAFILVWFYAREFALGGQDRIIRLEERMRLARLLPDDLRNSAETLTTKQLIALRFASDDELAALTRKIIADDITDGKEIKQLIRTWRPDNQRI